MPLWLFLKRCSSRRSASCHISRRSGCRQHAPPCQLSRQRRCIPTRVLVGGLLGNGTEPCRLAGDMDRLPGALVEWAPDPGKSPAPVECVANEDAPLASAITLPDAYPQNCRLATAVAQHSLYTTALHDYLTDCASIDAFLQNVCLYNVQLKKQRSSWSKCGIK